MKHKACRNIVNSRDMGMVVCCICGYPIETRKEFSREHEPPLSRGGKRGRWRPAHKACNQRKGALTAEEYQLWLRLENRRNGNVK